MTLPVAAPVPRFERFKPGAKLSAQHVNRTSDVVERVAKATNYIGSILADWGDQEDGGGGGSGGGNMPTNLLWFEQSRQSDPQDTQDDGLNIHTDNVMTRVTMRATSGGETYNWIFFFDLNP